MVTVPVRLLAIVIANPKLKSSHFDVCDGHSGQSARSAIKGL